MELPANQEACQSVSLAIRDIRLKQYILKRAAAATATATPPPLQPTKAAATSAADAATYAVAAQTAGRQVFLICTNLPIDLP